MKLPTIHDEHSGSTEQIFAQHEQQLAKTLDEINEAAKGLYETPYASINLPLDNQHLNTCKRLAAEYKNVSLIVVVGIGGSNLGTIAIQEAVLGKLHNVNPGKRPRILYADTVDPDSISRINAILDAELKAKHRVVVNIISKSGGTTETVANAEILFATLSKYSKKGPKNAKGTKNSTTIAPWKRSVVVTTDDGSHLWHFAKQEGFVVISMPHNVGGRYSVLSPVGLFPLAVLGIDTKKLMDGAAHMRALCLKRERHENPAIRRALMLASARESGKNIADNLLFKTDLESIGKWYRQLMGESIGKEWNKDHTQQVRMGITPTVSIGSTDLHSMAQLYFGGPDDKFFTLFTVDKWKSESSSIVPDMHQYDALVPNIQKRKLSIIMKAISDSVAITLAKQNRRFCQIALPDTSEHTIGALLQLHMMEMIYLASILDVNPFDQPNVEDYKIETKHILSGK